MDAMYSSPSFWNGPHRTEDLVPGRPVKAMRSLAIPRGD